MSVKINLSEETCRLLRFHLKVERELFLQEIIRKEAERFRENLTKRLNSTVEFQYQDFTIELNFDGEPNRERETFEAEQAHIKEKLDQAFSWDNPYWLKIGDYARFKADDVLSVCYSWNDEKRFHYIVVRFRNSDTETTLEIPYGSIEFEK